MEDHKEKLKLARKKVKFNQILKVLIYSFDVEYFFSSNFFLIAEGISVT